MVDDNMMSTIFVCGLYLKLDVNSVLFPKSVLVGECTRLGRLACPELVKPLPAL